jgi:flagellar basal body rod protein FlgB
MDTATELVAKELEKITDDTGGQHRHMRDDFDRQLAALERHMTVLIQNVSNVSDERFKAIATQFAERDERSKQSDVERQKSLDAALAAAKEAVAAQQTANAASAAALQEANTVSIEKSETGFKERIDGLVLLMTTSNEAMGDKIVDLTKRLDRGEGHGAGQVEATAQRAETSRGNLMMASLVVAALAVIIPLTVVLISSR